MEILIIELIVLKNYNQLSGTLQHSMENCINMTIGVKLSLSYCVRLFIMMFSIKFSAVYFQISSERRTFMSMHRFSLYESNEKNAKKPFYHDLYLFIFNAKMLFKYMQLFYLFVFINISYIIFFQCYLLIISKFNVLFLTLNISKLCLSCFH